MILLKNSKAAASLCLLMTLTLITNIFAQTQIVPSEEQSTLDVQFEEPPEYSDAKVNRITDLEQMPRDVWITGKLGDYRLQNDLALIHISDVPAKEDQKKDQLPYYGALMDITTNVSSAENFHAIGPSIGSLNSITLAAESITTRQNPDGSASVIVNSRDYFSPFIVAETEYRMPKDMPGVQIITTVSNESNDQTKENVLASDFVQWGGMVTWVPGAGYVNQPTIFEEVEFTYARQYDQWILVAPEVGKMNIVYTGRDTSGLSYGVNQPLAPGETRTWRRWVLVGEEDPSYLYSQVLLKRSDTPTGTLVGRLIEREKTADGTMIEKGPIAGEDIFISPFKRDDLTTENEKKVLAKPYIIAQTDPFGTFQAVLPVGEYRIIPAPKSRFAPMPNTLTRIKEGEVIGVDFGASSSSKLKYEIVDENGQRMPGKISIEPLRNSSSVYLGPPGGLRSGNAVISPYGAGIIDLAPGNYRVTASRGIEYNTDVHRITVRDLQEVEQRFVVSRAFETPGWISADVGVRTNATESSPVDPRTRVSSAAAEGVEWLVSGDSNVATDLEPYVTELGLSKYLKTSPGYRHSGETTPFLGDFLLFPLDICGTGAALDFSQIKNATSSEAVMSSMRSLCPQASILLSRPIWPKGYLSLSGYDIVEGEFENDDWIKNFDAIELWEGKRQGLFTSSYNTYHDMIQSGIKTTAFGQSNSFSTLFQETGYPRVYIKSSEDDPLNISPEELSRNIKNRAVSVTNGPFVEFTANGQPMGSLITDTDGKVDVAINVYAANWVQPNSLSINLNGRFVRRILLNNAKPDENGLLFPQADDKEGNVVTIRPTGDAVLDIIVQGTNEANMDPVNPFQALVPGASIPQGQYPLAISAPIFIDADGDGKITIEKRISEDPTIEYEEDDPPF